MGMRALSQKLIIGLENNMVINTTTDEYGHIFNLKRDTPDRRDRVLFKEMVNIDTLPEKASNIKLMPPVMDQGQVGACVGFSGANTLYAVMKKDGHRKPFVPSPVFLYREARDLGGYVEEDGGAEIRLMWKAANKLGLPSIVSLRPKFDKPSLADESTLIFPEKSVWRKKPSNTVYFDAEKRQVLQYFKLENLGDILKCLADGFPAQIGILVFNSFYGASSPLYNIPEPNPTMGDKPLGWHAVTACGYDKPSKRILCRNQWGPTAHEGKPDFTLSFDFVTKYSSDCWTGRFIEGGKDIKSPVV